jgi:Zn/Cd-binding protein ZinT
MRRNYPTSTANAGPVEQRRRFLHEHVRDYGTWESVLSRLSDRTINDVWSLWKSRLSDAKMAALRKLLEQQRRTVPTR